MQVSMLSVLRDKLSQLSAARPGTTARLQLECAALAPRLVNLREVVRPSADAGRLSLRLRSDVLFEHDSVELTPLGRSALAQIARLLRTPGDRSYWIEGHCDAGRSSKSREGTKWAFAATQAQAVLSALTEAGIESARLNVSSFGEFHPIATNDTAVGRAENRRIEIVFLKDRPRVEQPQRRAVLI
jgi:flagellar motor protein MotB